MDLTASTFVNALPRILYELSTSSFVALDLELSGLCLPDRPQGGKNLQQFYEETKAAAEAYGVLQVGLTICYEDKEKGSYVLKPYNVGLNPCLDRNLNVNRNFTFNGWAMEFLAGHKFDVGKLFSDGVRYLSREEEIKVREEASRKWAPSSGEKSELKVKDENSRRFVDAVRREIDQWLETGKSRGKSINIPSTNGQGQAQTGLPKELTGQQKFLVHDLVRLEYPEMKTRGMPTFVQIEHRNGGAMNFEARMKEMNSRIQKHVGFRWIVEALVGGDLSRLEPSAFKSLVRDEEAKSIPLSALADRLKSRVRGNRPVVVVHNGFTDMVFFYQSFLGPLPAKVEDFMSLVHQAFPTLMDTKFLATQEFNAAIPGSSLEDINKALAKIRTPKIEVDGAFSKYMYKTSVHEAGFDSMLTAVAFIKLSTHLDEGKLPQGMKGALKDISYGIASPQSNPVEEMFPTNQGQARDPFADFIDMEAEAGSKENVPAGEVVQLELADTGREDVNRKARAGQLIPRLGSPFWRTYTNRLRVFGAIEKIAYFKAVRKTERATAEDKVANGKVASGKATNGQSPAPATGLLIDLD